ncbi:MAG: hypothetical protein U5L08_06000 [Xanthomonadales bacterium]|nr:hypothetical protein [Xanthomonadales bacterium]
MWAVSSAFVVEIERGCGCNHVGRRWAASDLDGGIVFHRADHVRRRNEQLVWLQHRALDVAASLFKAVLDFAPVVVRRLIDAWKQYQPVRAGQVVGQVGRVLEKQRQVLLEPLAVVALTDVLVGKSAPEVHVEAIAEGAPEGLPAVLVEGILARREHFDAFELAGGALAFGVEGADRFDFVVEQFQPVRLGPAHRPQVHDSPAYGELPGLPDLLGRLVAGRVQAAPETLGVEALAEVQVEALALHPGHGRQALHQCRDRRDDHARFHARQPRQEVQPPGDQVRVRRIEVVGQDLPVGKELGVRDAELVDVVSQVACGVAVRYRYQNRPALAAGVGRDGKRQRQAFEQGPLDARDSVTGGIEYEKALGHDLGGLPKPSMLPRAGVPTG